MHPILSGAHASSQLTDNLGAARRRTDTRSGLARLEAAANFDLGFPHDFIRDMQSFVFGDAGALVDDGPTN